MKSRQNYGIHFFLVLLQLQWLCVIGAPFLNLQCSNQNAALHLVTVFPAQLWRLNLGSVFT